MASVMMYNSTLSSVLNDSLFVDVENFTLTENFTSFLPPRFSVKPRILPGIVRGNHSVELDHTDQLRATNDTEHYIVGFVMIIMAMLGIVANGILIHSVLRTSVFGRFYGRLLLHRSMAEVVSCLIIATFFTPYVMISSSISDSLNIAFTTMFAFSLSTTYLIHFLVAVNRFCAVYFPIYYNRSSQALWKQAAGHLLVAVLAGIVTSLSFFFKCSQFVFSRRRYDILALGCDYSDHEFSETKRMITIVVIIWGSCAFAALSVDLLTLGRVILYTTIMKSTVSLSYRQNLRFFLQSFSLNIVICSGVVTTHVLSDHFDSSFTRFWFSLFHVMLGFILNGVIPVLFNSALRDMWRRRNATIVSVASKMRAALSTTEKICFNDKKCVFGRELYKCRLCRFEKCLKVGMNKKGIKALVKDEIPKTSPDLKIVKASQISTERDTLISTLNKLLYVEEKIAHLRYSTYFPYSTSKGVLDYFNDACAISNTRKHQVLARFAKPEAFLLFNEEMASSGHKFWMYLDLVLAIEYYKTMEIMSRLSRLDQIALLKGTLRQVASFHAAYDAYIRGHTDLVEPNDFVPFSHPHFRGEAFDRWHSKSCVRVCAQVKPTLDKIVLLKSIIALNPNAPNLSVYGQEVVAKERLKSTNMLMSLIRVERGGDEWISYFSRLYDIVNRNILADLCFSDLIFSKVIPLVSSRSDMKVEGLWLELLVQ
ncbi:hypothetical protein QR680_006195 [Steinernema hermaphroditum]|uniref:NR LBD domain-containing protein n=1 Tax=Steinernema hermaphroditum TaxID=289476 RepID=A0AA39HWY9_9BILA|nr:hypothetical protein QR680_006195 [Steinernema hermaphroditum]